MPDGTPSGKGVLSNLITRRLLAVTGIRRGVQHVPTYEIMLRPRSKSLIVTRNSFKRLAVLLVILTVALFWCGCMMINMPGTSYRGELPPLSAEQSALEDELRAHVQKLAGEIVNRSVYYPDGLRAAEQYIDEQLISAGYEIDRQTYEVTGVHCSNFAIEIKGEKFPEEIIVIGAHYDSVDDSPAANDNGSGVAATLALAKRFAATTYDRTVRFVLFVNEEPPFFTTQDMGSLVYARRCRERGENIIAMISLETIGYYNDERGSQVYPIKPVGWLYPDTGNFVGFVGNYDSRSLVRQAIESFRTHAKFPSEGAALPGWIEGVGWSDHWAFWQAGYKAIMITDTAPFRYPYYHTNQDTPDKLDYQRMARVVDGMAAVISDLANAYHR
jgi:hypothetical protein